MSKLLTEMVDFAKQSLGCVYNISEIHNSKQETVTITPANPCQNCYSVAKAFTVTAIGLAVDDGVLSTDERIIDIFADELPENMDPRWENMTVHHVLKHSAGFSGGFMDIDCVDANTFGDDYLGYLFKTPLTYCPGEGYAYSDAAFYLLSRVVTKKTGRLMDEYMWERVFYPLAFREMAWSKCPKGYPMGATGLYIYTEDMAKLGEVYVNGGLYNGKRILSEAWVNIVKSREYEFRKISDGKCYGKGGMRGQMLLFFPETKRVVAWHSYEGPDLTSWIKQNIDRFN